MADSILPQQKLDSLYRQWQAEPTPQLSLRLAEELRRAGQVERGVAVIEEYLSENPDHTSSKVALGKFLLDVDRPERAVELLEEVATQDPTHLVANKHLIRAYAAIGERRKAVDRLDLYTLLNESDPELDQLRRLVGDEEEGESVTPAPPGDSVVGVTAARVGAGPRGDQPGQGRTPASEPFSDLWQGVEDRWYRSALAAEGIFERVESARTGEAPAGMSAPTETPAAAEPPPIPPAEAAPLPAPPEEASAAEPTSEPPFTPGPVDLAPAAPAPAAHPPGWKLTAAELLERAELASDADRTTRRGAVLRAYLDRLRAGAAGDV